MTTKTLSEIIGGSGIARMAVDTTWFTTHVSANLYTSVSAIDASSGLTEILGLTGRFLITHLQLQAMDVNDMTDIRLTIDGVNIWDETGITVNAANESLIGVSVTGGFEAFLVQTDFSLKVQMGADTSINLLYVIRPIL